MYLIYFMLWVIFNGQLTLEVCVFGLVVSAALLVFSCRFMDYSLAKECKIYKNFFLCLKYIALMVKEVVKANISVIHLILTQEEEIEPILVSFRSDLKTQMGRALVANAITLTPGTITVTLEGAEYKVHCLDESLAEGIQNSEFIKYIHEFED